MRDWGGVMLSSSCVCVCVCVCVVCVWCVVWCVCRNDCFVLRLHYLNEQYLHYMCAETTDGAEVRMGGV